MIGFRDFFAAFRSLSLDRTRPVIAHASLSAFGDVLGGAETVLGALLGVFETVIMPTFTYLTMLIPEEGPPDNGITYGSGRSVNRMAEFFTDDMPADKMMGVLPETLRRQPAAIRSMHPIMSFSGVNALFALQSQTLDDPLAPIHALHEAQGWVLLLGVDHTTNTSIHYAETLAGRPLFRRWALTPRGVVECACAGCSDGFQALAPRLDGVMRQVRVGSGVITAVPLVEQTRLVKQALAKDRRALLCNRLDCERCNAIRAITRR